MNDSEDNVYYPPQTHSYFYGRISREEAENVLNRNGMQNGMFLLRECMNKIGSYIVSVVCSDKIRHYEIARTESGELELKGVNAKYSGPIDAIKHLKKEEVPLNLRVPSNRNFSTQPIQYLFISTREFNEAVMDTIKRKAKDNISKSDAEGKYRYKYEALALKEIHSKQIWFRRNFTKRDAEKLFKISLNQKHGTFLVRCSTFFRSLKLNVWNEAKQDFESYKIMFDNHSFFIKDSAGEDFDTLTQLIDFYGREMGKKFIDITLKQPCVDEELHEYKCDTNRSYEINVLGRESTEIEDNKDIYKNLKIIEFKNYQVKLIKLIGSGAFSKVYQGEYRSHNGKITKKVAVKILAHSDPIGLLSEKKMLKSLEHKHIVKLQETLDDDDLNDIGAIDSNADFRNKCILLEFAELGSLSSYLKTHTIEKKIMLTIARQIAEALEFLASKDIIHRDVAARNVLLFKSDYAKLSDFGLTRNYNSDNYYYQTTPLHGVPVKWYAPEVITSGGRFNEKSDVYSYGVMLWEMFAFGETPYKDESIQEPNLFAKKIKNGEIKLRKPEDCPDSVYNLMNACWKIDKDSRPTFIEIQSLIDDIMQNLQ